MSIDVIGYFHAITCFDCALSLDTCWIQQALWEKVVSTPCRERVNCGGAVMDLTLSLTEGGGCDFAFKVLFVLIPT
jgi:hypothetical protein